MKYVSPMYEKALLEASDILMSGEVIMNENADGSADFVINASSVFKYLSNITE
ncbi:MAG: hypothetical protein IJC80_04080 [Clostridia bacterium]|nr:hypothetical protein [Clostridia bacterium]